MSLTVTAVHLELTKLLNDLGIHVPNSTPIGVLIQRLRQLIQTQKQQLREAQIIAGHWEAAGAAFEDSIKQRVGEMELPSVPGRTTSWDRLQQYLDALEDKFKAEQEAHQRLQSFCNSVAAQLRQHLQQVYPAGTASQLDGMTMEALMERYATEVKTRREVKDALHRDLCKKYDEQLRNNLHLINEKKRLMDEVATLRREAAAQQPPAAAPSAP